MPDRDALRSAGEDLVRRVDEVMRRVDWGGFADLTNRLIAAKRVFVTGAGRSGLVAQAFAMRLMHAGLTAFVPGETITPAAEAGDLLVAVSCTGTTGYTDYLARRARELGAKVIVVTAVPDSPLARDADKVVAIPSPPEDIVLRAAVFEHTASLCLDAIYSILSQRLSVDVAAYQRRHANLE